MEQDELGWAGRAFVRLNKTIVDDTRETWTLSDAHHRPLQKAAGIHGQSSHALFLIFQRIASAIAKQAKPNLLCVMAAAANCVAAEGGIVWNGFGCACTDENCLGVVSGEPTLLAPSLQRYVRSTRHNGWISGDCGISARNGLEKEICKMSYK